MQVEAGRVRVLALLVAEVQPDVRLVGRFVLGEPDVAVDAEQRTTLGPRVGAEVRADLHQVRPEIDDEAQRRLPHLGLVAGLLLVEPVAVVVSFEVGQELLMFLQSQVPNDLAGYRGVGVGAAGIFYPTMPEPDRWQLPDGTRGGMSLEDTLTSRDNINSQLRVVLDEATGRWGIRINRVELKSVDPPPTIQEAMEKQMRAERDKRAAASAGVASTS